MSKYTKQLVDALIDNPMISADDLADLAFDDNYGIHRKRNWDRIDYAMEKGAIARILQPIQGRNTYYWYYVPRK